MWHPTDHRPEWCTPGSKYKIDDVPACRVCHHVSVSFRCTVCDYPASESIISHGVGAVLHHPERPTGKAAKQ